ncbi:MAG: hypothetical protein AAFY60_12630, partial [Myxococcota bacterium]
MRRRVALFVALGAVLAIVALGLWRARTVSPQAVAELNSEATRYTLSFASSDRLAAAMGTGANDAAIATRIELDVELLVDRIASQSQGEIRRRFRFSRCDEGRFALGEQELWADRADCEAELVGPEFLIDYGPRGEIVRVHEPEDSTELFGRIATFVLSEISFWKPEFGVELDEKNLRGVAISRYEAVSEGEWIRHRSAYRSLAARELEGAQSAKVSARHRLRLDGDLLREFVGAETVRVHGSSGEVMSSLGRIELRYIGVEPAPPGVARTFKARGIHSVEWSDTLNRRMLVQQAAGLTETEFLDTLSRFAGGGRLPDHDRFLWRSYALLMLNPQLARKLM